MATYTTAPSATASRACPSCGSGDTASLRSIWEQGTSTSEGTVVGLVGDQWGIGATAGGGMTEAARRAAPPARANVSEPATIMAGAAIVMCVALYFWALPPEVRHRDDMTLPAQYAVLAAVLLICGVFERAGLAMLRDRGRYNATEWPTLHARWSRRWSCRRCGATFEPGGDRH